MRSLAAVAVCVAATSASAAPTLVTQSDPHPGIHSEVWADNAVPVTLHLVRIDLTSAEIALYATKQSQAGITTSAYAAQVSAQVAINGDSFAVANYVPRGLAMGDSDPWSNTADDGATAVMFFRRVGERTFVEISPPEEIVTTAMLPAGTQGVISGRPLLVRSGVVEMPSCSDPVTVACQPAPRSAIGVSADGNRLWLVTVDGWQGTSIGMQARDVGAFLHARGADMAMALDSGSSSTLVIDGAVVNMPSDGVERPVANHLAIKYGSLPKGQLVGFICKHDVFGCPGSSRILPNSSVTLDDGRKLMSDTAGFYDFPNVTQRLACVVVKKVGFVTKRQCAQVTAANPPTYNSVAMWEGVDPPDAGVGDGGVPDDAPTFGRADAYNGDAGFGAQTPGGGCCDAGRDRPCLPLFVFVAWFLVRRRGTTL
jgi:exopolysaccharide biosynthesis protein